MKNLRNISLFLFVLTMLSGCKVPAVFSYAFFGTAILLVISLFIAGNISKKGEGHH